MSTPSSPSKVASLPLPTSSLALVGNVLYAGTTDKRLVVINVANPAAPVAGGTTSLAGYPVTIGTNGSLLFIAADTAGLLTYSVAIPAAPAFLSQFKPSSAVESVAVEGNLALLAATDGGFVIADLSNPGAPVLAGQVPLDQLSCFADLDPAAYPPGLISIALNNGIAYAGSANMFARVFGFDYRQTAHPRMVSATAYSTSIVGSVLAFAFYGSNMFVGVDFGAKIFEADVTQPRNFIRHMCFPVAFGANDAANFP